VYQLLAEFRELLFHAGVDQSNHNVHNYNYILRHLGKKYGLPGWEAMAKFDDPYGGVTLSTAETKFLALYTPAAIIVDLMQQYLKDNGELREQFVDWQKSECPSRVAKRAF